MSGHLDIAILVLDLRTRDADLGMRVQERGKTADRIVLDDSVRIEHDDRGKCRIELAHAPDRRVVAVGEAAVARQREALCPGCPSAPFDLVAHLLQRTVALIVVHDDHATASEQRHVVLTAGGLYALAVVYAVWRILSFYSSYYSQFMPR